MVIILKLPSFGILVLNPAISIALAVDLFLHKELNRLISDILPSVCVQMSAQLKLKLATVNTVDPEVALFDTALFKKMNILFE